MMEIKIKLEASSQASSQAISQASTHSNSAEWRRLQRNIPSSMWLRFFYVFGIIMPLIVPLFQSKGLGMQEIFALQTIFALAMLVSEVPSGYLADVFGRRKIILCGAIGGRPRPQSIVVCRQFCCFSNLRVYLRNWRIFALRG